MKVAKKIQRYFDIGVETKLDWAAVYEKLVRDGYDFRIKVAPMENKKIIVGYTSGHPKRLYQGSIGTAYARRTLSAQEYLHNNISYHKGDEDVIDGTIFIHKITKEEISRELRRHQQWRNCT